MSEENNTKGNRSMILLFITMFFAIIILTFISINV